MKLLDILFFDMFRRNTTVKLEVWLPFDSTLRPCCSWKKWYFKTIFRSLTKWHRISSLVQSVILCRLIIRRLQILPVGVFRVFIFVQVKLVWSLVLRFLINNLYATTSWQAFSLIPKRFLWSLLNSWNCRVKRFVQVYRCTCFQLTVKWCKSTLSHFHRFRLFRLSLLGLGAIDWGGFYQSIFFVCIT